jgi:hypothetical protein
VSALGLLNIPIGTLKGVYFLWVLLQNDTIKLFENRQMYQSPASQAAASQAEFKNI